MISKRRRYFARAKIELLILGSELIREPFVLNVQVRRHQLLHGCNVSSKNDRRVHIQLDLSCHQTGIFFDCRVFSKQDKTRQHQSVFALGPDCNNTVRKAGERESPVHIGRCGTDYRTMLCKRDVQISRWNRLAVCFSQ
ncbi:MAG: hypothetical protein DWI29_05235 [Planctomycetota bacterium]|nr:MAG: hypothetical protein DWI29_05235 [Planctomycetota bacterium]